MLLRKTGADPNHQVFYFLLFLPQPTDAPEPPRMSIPESTLCSWGLKLQPPPRCFRTRGIQEMQPSQHPALTSLLPALPSPFPPHPLAQDPVHKGPDCPPRAKPTRSLRREDWMQNSQTWSPTHQRTVISHLPPKPAGPALSPLGQP